MPKAKKCTAFKCGDNAKIVGNSNGHCIPFGTVVTVMGPHCAGYWNVQNYPSVAIATGDLELFMYKFTKGSVEKDRAELAAQVAFLDAKLSYLEETGLESGCDKEFKIYQAMTLLENGDMSKQDKAKAIASLLNI